MWQELIVTLELRVIWLISKTSTFNGPDDLLPCSLERITEPYPEPDEFSPQRYTSLKIPTLV
jgi:hypothetical protein